MLQGWRPPRRKDTFSIVMRDGVVILSDRGSGQSVNVFDGAVIHNVASTSDGTRFQVAPGTNIRFLEDGNMSITKHASEVKEELKGTEIPPSDRVKDERATDQDTSCTICNDNKPCMTFDPCGHLVTCYSCVAKLKATSSPSLIMCPCCCAYVRKAIRTYS